MSFQYGDQLANQLHVIAVSTLCRSTKVIRSKSSFTKFVKKFRNRTDREGGWTAVEKKKKDKTLKSSSNNSLEGFKG